MKRVAIDGAPRGIAGQHAFDKVAQRFGDTSVPRPGWRRRVYRVIETLARAQFGRSRVRQQLVEHRADREDLVGDLEGIPRPVLFPVLAQILELLGSAETIRSRGQATLGQLLRLNVGR